MAWSTLTADQQNSLLADSNNVEIDAGCELLNFDLSVAADISEDLEPNGGDVSWTGDQTVPRDCSLTLSRELAWGSDLIRPYLVYKDSVTGLSARENLGAFIAESPETNLAKTPTSHVVTGPDRTAWLDREINRSFAFTAGGSVLAAIERVVQAAGLPGYRINPLAAAAKIPSPMAYPLIPSSGDSSTVDSTVTLPDDFGGSLSSSSTPTTYRQILNDLLELIFYRAVYADNDGFLVFEPYVDASLRDSSFEFTADTMTATIEIDRSVTKTVDTVNEWFVVNSALPDLGGVPATPVRGNGIAYRENLETGPASITAMHGLRFPSKTYYAAATQAVLEKAADALKASDMRTVYTISATTVPYPPAGHFDVFTVTDAGLDEGTVKVEALSWSTSLATGGTAWSWRVV